MQALYHLQEDQQHHNKYVWNKITQILEKQKAKQIRQNESKTERSNQAKQKRQYVWLCFCKAPDNIATSPTVLTQSV